MRESKENFLKFFVLVMFAILECSVIAETYQKIGGKDVKFMMGSPESEVEVVFSKAFEIMTTEVTQQMWFDVMKKNPSWFKTSDYCDNHLKIGDEDLCPNHPVENVSWNSVQIYIKNRNEAEGLTGCRGIPEGPKGCYRLPTAAEWEYAARGGTETAYSFGGAKIGAYAWFLANSDNKTHPVKTRLGNPYGLHDMHGNVWEWVQDYWTWELPGGRDPLVTSGSYRVIRGGSWDSGAWDLRSAGRLYDVPVLRGVDLGFRLVRNL